MAHRIAEAISDHIVELSQTRLAEMVSSFKTLKRANEELEYITGVHLFFSNLHEFQEFRQVVTLPAPKTGVNKNREWGDFQTPPNLAKQVCLSLADCGISPTVAVEPTYGLGNFILAALDTFPMLNLIYGVEIQDKYEWHLKIALLIKALRGQRGSTRIELHRDNIFEHEFPAQVAQSENILIVGNPPWVTSAELGVLESQNLPAKQNLKSLNGMDALTGKSNFDISEYILLRLLDQFATHPGTLAMLCKRATAKNIVEILPQKRYTVSNIKTLEFDAAKEFGVAVEACVLVMDLGVKAERICQVAQLGNSRAITKVFGWVDEKFVSNVSDYQSNADLDGKSILVWRQGLKHDCARIMEIDVSGENLLNGNGDVVDVEQDYLYYLYKSSDLREFEASHPRKQVIVTQNRLGEDTALLKTKAPKLWKYLLKNGKYLDARKSSIYHNKSRFSIFGVGDYSFKPYKVAISGLYKELNFSLVCPIDNRPVMLDDTCYLLGFETYLEALFVASLFNSARIKRFLASIVFTDAKRPYTKEILMRVDVGRAIVGLSFQSITNYWKHIGYTPRISVTPADWANFKARFSVHEKSENIEQTQFAIPNLQSTISLH